MKRNNNTNTRQKELLKKYYNLDESAKTVKLYFRYKRASEILNTNVGNPLFPTFNDETLSLINNAIDNNNPGFKVELNFEIENYEAYSPKNIIEAFNDTLEIKQYGARHKRQLKTLLCSIFVLIGTLVLLLMAIIKQEHLILNETNQEIFSEILNIVAWVFIWEAVSMFFIEHSEQTKFAIKIKKNVSRIVLYKKGDESPIAKEEANQIFGKWENENKIKKLGKAFTLISSFIFIFLAFFSIYQVKIVIEKEESIELIHKVLIFIISFSSFMLLGIIGITSYLEKYAKIKKFITPFIVILTILIISLNVFSLIIKNTTLQILSIFSLIINIIYIIGYLIDKKI